MMDNGYLFTIGDLARAVGCKTTTIRYYERIGLLAQPRRTMSGYRLYDREARERLRFLRSAHAMGFGQQDLKALVDARYGDGFPRAPVRAIATSHLALLGRKIRNLQRAADILTAACGTNADRDGADDDVVAAIDAADLDLADFDPGLVC